MADEVTTQVQAEAQAEPRVRVTLRADVRAARVALPVGAGVIVVRRDRAVEVPESVYRAHTRYLKRA